MGSDRATVYYYYGSKQEIYYDLIRQAVEQIRCERGAAIARKAGFGELDVLGREARALVAVGDAPHAPNVTPRGAPAPRALPGLRETVLRCIRQVRIGKPGLSRGVAPLARPRLVLHEIRDARVAVAWVDRIAPKVASSRSGWSRSIGWLV